MIAVVRCHEKMAITLFSRWTQTKSANVKMRVCELEAWVAKMPLLLPCFFIPYQIVFSINGRYVCMSCLIRAYMVFEKNIKLRKIKTRWIPHLLSDKQQRVQV